MADAMLTPSNKKTPYIGVRPVKNGFKAEITINAKKVDCGTYDTAEEAARARDVVALENRGTATKTRLNFPEVREGFSPALTTKSNLGTPGKTPGRTPAKTPAKTPAAKTPGSSRLGAFSSPTEMASMASPTDVLSPAPAGASTPTQPAPAPAPASMAAVHNVSSAPCTPGTSSSNYLKMLLLWFAVPLILMAIALVYGPEKLPILLEGMSKLGKN